MLKALVPVWVKHPIKLLLIWAGILEKPGWTGGTLWRFEVLWHSPVTGGVIHRSIRLRAMNADSAMIFLLREHLTANLDRYEISGPFPCVS